MSLRIYGASWLSNHWHVLLIVPLVVIVMTWPVLPQLFNTDEFWLHSSSRDVFHRIWESWHIGKVLAGQAELWHTFDMFHPRGVSLVFQHFSFPHALLMLALNKVMPVDSAVNLLFLVILCFNGFSAYVLIRHLLKDKWVALFGGVVAVLAINFSHSNIVPDLICIGTLPLTLYFFHRACFKERTLFAALAGFCAGITAFIGMYTFAFILLSVALYAAFLLPARWRHREFWRLLLVFALLCAAISALRIYPIVADAGAFQEGLDKYDGWKQSNDLLQFFVHSRNPFTGRLLHSLFHAAPNAIYRYNIAYLGYINLFFLACALLRIRRGVGGSTIPWILLFTFFAIMRLGDYLTFNGVAYQDIVLPHHVLDQNLPMLFGQIGSPSYYLFALVTPLSLLSSYGLASLLRGRSARTRALVSLVAILFVAFEFYAPIKELTVPKGATAYVEWMKSEPDDSIKIINLPREHEVGNPHFFMYLQTLTGYPHVDGFSNRIPQRARGYIDGNLLLRRWNDSRSVHCLPHNERSFLSALDNLLQDGITHVVVHNWRYGDQFINHSFRNVPASYDNGSVSVYRLRDLRQSCGSKPIEIAHFRHFAESPSAIPGLRSAILSVHPSDSIDEDLFAYLDSLFDDWQSLLHLYIEDGEPMMQFAGKTYPATGAFARDNQVIYRVYNQHDTVRPALQAYAPFDDFRLCQRDEHEDGSVIELYLLREFSCELVSSSQPLQVDYDNGARLVNAHVEATRDKLEIQLMWSNLPDEPHSVSLQVFDNEGAKAFGLDATIGHASLGRYLVDVADLSPGDYTVKLVVYNYETRRSVSGTISGTGERFEREIPIMAWTQP